MKIALTGIIKNEAHDLLYWLAWHARLGVDSFILFDDNSSDGTRDLLTVASLYWDIRLYHVRDIAISLHRSEIPGKAALLYQDALTKLQGEFDWAGLITADDYVTLHHHANLREFLASQTETTSWIDLPLLNSAPQADAAEATSPFLVGERIAYSRCFLRPEHWQPADEQAVQEKGAFIQQHNDGHEGDGPQPVWPSSPPSAISSPDDLPITLTSFHTVLAKTSTIPGNNIVSEIMTGLFSVIRAGMLNTLEELKLTKPVPPRLSLQPPRKMTEHIQISYLQSETGRPIGMRDKLAQVIPEGETAPLLMLLQRRSHPSKGFIFAWGEDNTIHSLSILGDRHAGGLLAYDILPVIGREAIALGIDAGIDEKMGRQFLSCPPEGPLAANRSRADLWEFFTLVPLPLTPEDSSWLEHPVLQFAETILAEPVSLQSITQLLHIDRDMTIWLLPLLASCLPRHEELELAGYLGPFAQFSL